MPVDTGRAEEKEAKAQEEIPRQIQVNSEDLCLNKYLPIRGGIIITVSADDAFNHSQHQLQSNR